MDIEVDEENYPDEGCQLSCLVHHSCHPPHNPDMSQRDNLFRTRGRVNGKVSQMIIDNGSMDNLISEDAAKKLGLTIQNHPKPYTVGWIHNGDVVRITQTCEVPLSIGRRYKDIIKCDVVKMDATHILLGCPWQFDMDATCRGRLYHRS